jgi:hypothetical protein
MIELLCPGALIDMLVDVKDLKMQDAINPTARPFF